jgi:hypothetical protein
MFQTCPSCKKPETVYRKTYYENGHKLDCPNIFYLCANPQCLLHFNIVTNVRFYDESNNISFEWIKIHDPTLPSLWGKSDSVEAQALSS